MHKFFTPAKTLLGLLLLGGTGPLAAQNCPEICTLSGIYTAESNTFLLSGFNPTSSEITTVTVACTNAQSFTWAPALPNVVSAGGDGSTVTIQLQPGQSVAQTVTARGEGGCVMGTKRLSFLYAGPPQDTPPPPTPSATNPTTTDGADFVPDTIVHQAPVVLPTPAQITLTPELTLGPVLLYTKSSYELHVEVLTPVGRVIWQKDLVTAGEGGQMDFTDYPLGPYFVRVRDENGFVQMFKFFLHK